MAITKEINITVNSEKAVKGINDVDKSLKNVKTSGSQTNESLSSTALASAKSFKVMGVSINGVSSMLKVLKVSLIATGIGAIVVVVGTLAAAFLSTQSGVDKLNSVLTPLKAVLGTIWGVIQNLSKGIVEMLSGDVLKGWNSMGNAVDNLGNKMDEAWKKGKRLHELQMQIRDNELNLITATTDLNIQKAKALEIAEDETRAINDRKKGYKDAIDSENSIAAIRKTILQSKIDELSLSQSINDTSSDEYKELVQLESDLKNAEYQRLVSTTALTKRLNRVKGEAPDAPKEGERKAVKGVEAYIPEDDPELTAEQVKADAKIAINRATENQIQIYKQQIRKEEEEEDRIAAEKKKQLEQDVANAKINIAQNGLSLVGEIAKKGSKLGKAVAIAQATISAIQGTQNAFTIANESPITALFPAYPFIQAGLAGAFGAVQVAKIASAKEVGASGGLSSGGSGGGAGVAAPSFNLVQGTQGNQIANSINQQNSQPLKAYVVSGDMTSQQSLDRNAKTNSSL